MAETKVAHRWTILRIAKYIGIIIGTLLCALLILAAVFFWNVQRVQNGL
jgi:hypothetical protein